MTAYYNAPTKLALGLILYGLSIIFCITLFVVAHLTMVWAERLKGLVGALRSARQQGLQI